MVKKPYILPVAVTVALGAMHMVAESAPDIHSNPGAEPVQGSELDVKENWSVWDKEW